MTLAPATQALLPECANARIALFAMRRIGAHGLADARAAHVMLTTFGASFRRPTPISIAPCCCPRMTPAEQALITILARAETAPETARLLMADLLGLRRVDGVLTSAAAVAAAFADAGRPIAG